MFCRKILSSSVRGQVVSEHPQEISSLQNKAVNADEDRKPGRGDMKAE